MWRCSAEGGKPVKLTNHEADRQWRGWWWRIDWKSAEGRSRVHRSCSSRKHEYTHWSTKCWNKSLFLVLELDKGENNVVSFIRPNFCMYSSAEKQNTNMVCFEEQQSLSSEFSSDIFSNDKCSEPHPTQEYFYIALVHQCDQSCTFVHCICWGIGCAHHNWICFQEFGLASRVPN